MSTFSFNIALSFDTDTGKVQGCLTPAYDAPEITEELILELLKARGYGDYFVLQDKIEELCVLSQENVEGGQRILEELKKRAAQQQPDEDDGKTASDVSLDQVFSLLPKAKDLIEIAEVRDGDAEVYPSDDDMKLFLSIKPPYGGEEITLDQILEKVSSLGIEAKIDHEVITTAIEAKKRDSVVIAKGIPAKRGRSSFFQALVKPQITSAPVIDEKGVANYLDINDFVVVEPGEKLMRRVSPKPGRPGKDIFGKVIPAETGDILPFDANLEGAKVDPKDGDTLIATAKGHPIILDRGVSISDVLQLPNVSLATGNIDYDGSVYVKGDVSDGMSIKASGDVIVDGVVGKANIKAGNDVLIQQGLIGGTPSDKAGTGEFGATIDSGGSVSIRFANMGKINAKNISIREYASHCQMNAIDKVLIGEESGKGTLIGGETTAFNMVSAKIMGSTGGTVTNIRIGAESDTIDKLLKTNHQIRQRNDAISELEEELQELEVRSRRMDLSEHQKEKQEEMRQKVQLIRAELSNFTEKSNKLKELLMRSKKARVISKFTIYQNVKVDILSSSYRMKEDASGGSFRFDARKVIFER